MPTPLDPTLGPTARQRDGSICQICGLKPELLDALQVAHIQSLASAGPRTLDNVVTLCANCHANIDREYIAKIISESPGAIGGFREGVAKVRALNAAPLPSEELRVALRNLLFANVIAALETYLSDTLIGAVTSDRALVRRALRSVPELRERKVELCKLFERLEEIDAEVRNYLIDVIYHNLGKVKPLYLGILCVKLPEAMNEVSRAIHTRHDIVHRNGKTKEGTPVVHSAAEVEWVATLVESFVEEVESQVVRKPWRE